MREILQEILDYTYNNTLFHFLKLYHIKGEVLEIIPDLVGTVTRTEPETNQLVTTATNIPWLENNIKVRFTGINNEISNEKYYYIKNIVGNSTCTKFSIGETTLPGEILPITSTTGSFNIIHDRSYIIVNDTSWMDLGMRIVLEEYPTPNNNYSPLSATTGLSPNTKYFIYEIFDNNKIRLSLSQFTKNSSNNIYGNFIHFSTALLTSFEIIQDHTFIEGVTEDKVVYLEARTDEKIVNFNQEFGMFDLYKLFNILENTNEYPTNSNIIVTNVDEENDFVSTKLNFVNPDGTFKDEWQLIDKLAVPEQHEMIDFTNSLWNFGLQITPTKISRFNDMALTYVEYVTFDLYTLNADTITEYNLEFYFGEDNPNFGQITFDQNIKGTYVPKIIDEFKTIATTNAEYVGTIYRQLPERNYFIGPFLDEENTIISIEDTSILEINMPIKFSNTPDSSDAVTQAGLSPDINYYVKEIFDCNTFSFSSVPGGAEITLPFTNFQLFLTVQLNILQIFDFTGAFPIQTNNKEIWKYLEPNMPIKFRNPPDSTNAMLQAELDETRTYYVKQIKKFLDAEETFLVTGIDSEGILSLDVPDDKEFIDVLYPGIEVYFSNLPDSSGALEEAELVDPNNPDPYKKYYIKETFPGGFFTLSSEPDGEQLPLPYSNFEFEMKMDFVRLEFSISETINGPEKIIPYANFQFEIYHKANEIIVDDTTWFRKNMPIVFEPYQDSTSILSAGLETSKRYYIQNILNNRKIKITDQIDGEVIELNDSLNQFFIRHDTGNGYIFSSALGTPQTTLSKDPTIYTRNNLYTPDLDPIPNTDPYDHIFGNYTLPLPAEPSSWHVFYNNDDDYIYGNSALSPIFSADYIITISNVGEIYQLTGEDRNGTFNLEQNRALTFYIGDKVEFIIDPATAAAHPFWLKTKVAKKTRYQIDGSYGNGTTNIKWTVTANGTFYYLCPFHVHMSSTINVPPAITATYTYQDQNIKRAFDLRRPVSKNALEDTYVYTFEVDKNVITEIKKTLDLTNTENEAKIYVNNRNSYITVVGHLDKRWTYNVPQILAIILLESAEESQKVMRISDEGRLMISIKSPNGIYNYILQGTEKIL